jgi:YD repeat-containing protein
MTQRFGNQLVSYALTLGPKSRIAEKLERVGLRETRFTYEYDPKGRLARVLRNGRPAEEYGYDEAGRRSRDWTPERGRRVLDYDRAGRLKRAGEVEYYYGQDDTLTARYVGKKQALHLDYAHNLGLRSLCNTHGRPVNYRTSPAGQPLEKYADNEVYETFRWLDLVRLADYDCLERGYRLAFHYQSGNRLPSSLTFRDEEGARQWLLGYDQVGSLKAVGDEQGELIKTIDYDSFGTVLSEDWPWLFAPWASPAACATGTRASCGSGIGTTTPESAASWPRTRPVTPGATTTSTSTAWTIRSTRWTPGGWRRFPGLGVGVQAPMQRCASMAMKSATMWIVAPIQNSTRCSRKFPNPRPMNFGILTRSGRTAESLSPRMNGR